MPITTHFCKNCGMPFQGTARAKFDSPKCRAEYWRKQKAILEGKKALPPHQANIQAAAGILSLGQAAEQGDEDAIKYLDQADRLLNNIEMNLSIKRRNSRS